MPQVAAAHDFNHYWPIWRVALFVQDRFVDIWVKEHVGFRRLCEALSSEHCEQLVTHRSNLLLALINGRSASVEDREKIPYEILRRSLTLLVTLGIHPAAVVLKFRLDALSEVSKFITLGLKLLSERNCL